MKKIIFAALILFSGLSSISYAAPMQQNVQLVKANEVLQAGSVIPATLLTAIDSDNMNSTIVAIVRQSVYDSVTGEKLLIPAGTKIIGETTGLSGKRVNISFSRIIFPTGNSVMLPDLKAIDGIGYAGLRDKYSTHSWLAVRSILTGTVFAGALAAATDRKTGKRDERTAGEEAMAGALSSFIQGINSEVQRQNSRLNPTATIREGYQFNILLNVDVKIRPYEEQP